MTEADFKSLQVGDIVCHVRINLPRESMVVTGNYGDHVTLVRTVEASNPVEWELVAKAAHKFT